MIRHLLASESIKAAPLAHKFFVMAREPGIFCHENFAQFWARQYNAGTGVILAELDGLSNVVAVLGLTTFRDPWTNDLNAGELFWFSESGNSGHLVRKALKVAKSIGVKNFFMQHTHALRPDRIAKFYLKMGFKPVFHQYRKEL